MNFTFDFLKELKLRRVFGEEYPFCTQDKQIIETHIHKIIGKMQRADGRMNIEIRDANRLNCYSNCTCLRISHTEHNEKMIIYISNHVPIWCYGFRNSLDDDFVISAENIEPMQKQFWYLYIEKLSLLFNIYGFIMPEQEEIKDKFYYIFEL